MKIKQETPQDLWPSNIGQSIMTLNLSPEHLALKYKIKFEEASDDLDNYRFAALFHPSIGQIWLWKYDNSIDTDVLVDSFIEPTVAQKLVIDLLSLDTSDISWMLSSG